MFASYIPVCSNVNQLSFCGLSDGKEGLCLATLNFILQFVHMHWGIVRIIFGPSYKNVIAKSLVMAHLKFVKS